MLAFADSEPALLYGRQLEGVLSISKIVMNVIFSAGLAMFMHFTETRIGPEFFFLDSTIGGPHSIHASIQTTRALEEGEHVHRHRLLSDAQVSDAQESSQNDFETQAPALHKMQFFTPSREQKLQPELNDRNAYQPYVEIIKAFLVEFVVFSVLVVASIRRVLPNTYRTADQRSLDDCDLPSTTRSVLLGEDIPPNDSGGPGENQRQPGANRRRLVNVLGDLNLNDFRNRFIARGGPPPPPPPPPAFGLSMQHGDKWLSMIDYWISLLLLLPILTFLLKRLFGGRKGAKTQGYHTVKKAGTCPNVIPLRERRSSEPTTTTVRWMLPGPNNQTRRTHLHNQALYPVNLTRWFIRFLFMLCSLALSSLFPVVALVLAIAAWYYLPDVILPFLLDRTIIGAEPGAGLPNAVGLSQNTDTPPESSGPDVAVNTNDDFTAGTNRITNESTQVEYLTL